MKSLKLIDFRLFIILYRIKTNYTLSGDKVLAEITTYDVTNDELIHIPMTHKII